MRGLRWGCAIALGCLIVLSEVGALPAVAEVNGKKKIVFIAGRASHGFGSHEHYAGCKLLAQCLETAMPRIQCVVTKDGYPSDASVFEGCDAVVVFSDGGGGHPLMGHLAEIDALAEKGVGVACLHYAVEVPKGEPGEHFLKWIGGYFESDWSVNPHWTARFEQFPDHPITRGVGAFEMNDEWYYHMRFREGMQGVTPILAALPGAETLNRPDGPHSNNPGVRAAVLERKEPQLLAWAAERANGQRGFGFTGGHHHWSWADPNFLRVVLNAVVWVARCEVPPGGVPACRISMKDLLANQDYPVPDNFKPESIQSQFGIPAE